MEHSRIHSVGTYYSKLEEPLLEYMYPWPSVLLVLVCVFLFPSGPVVSSISGFAGSVSTFATNSLSHQGPRAHSGFVLQNELGAFVYLCRRWAFDRRLALSSEFKVITSMQALWGLCACSRRQDLGNLFSAWSSWSLGASLLCLHACTHACMYVHICVGTHVVTCTHAFVFTYIEIRGVPLCMCIYDTTCMYVNHICHHSSHNLRGCCLIP